MSIGYMAEKTARLILGRADDPRLKWYADGRVRVRIGMIVPDETGDMQTLVDLRKRFRRAVRDRLRRAGWQTAGLNVYAPPSRQESAPQAQDEDVAAICLDGRPCGGYERHGSGIGHPCGRSGEIQVQTGHGGMNDPALDGSNQIQDKEMR